MTEHCIESTWGGRMARLARIDRQVRDGTYDEVPGIAATVEELIAAFALDFNEREMRAAANVANEHRLTRVGRFEDAMRKLDTPTPTRPFREPDDEEQLPPAEPEQDGDRWDGLS